MVCAAQLLDIADIIVAGYNAGINLFQRSKPHACRSVNLHRLAALPIR